MSAKNSESKRVAEMEKEIDTLKAAKEELLSVLRAVEWEGNDPDYEDCCPECECYPQRYGIMRHARNGHSKECRLNAAILLYGGG